jgi:serine/threonine protein kinase
MKILFVLLLSPSALSSPELVKRGTVDEYNIGQEIGAQDSGRCGTVTKAERISDGLFVALKSLKSVDIDEEWMRTSLVKEVEILEPLSHPSIIRLLDVVYTDTSPRNEVVENEARFNVFELGGPSLKSLNARGEINVHDGKVIFRDIVEGVQYLHSESICHRGSFILITFRSPSWKCRSRTAYQRCGTIATIALPNSGQQRHKDN